MNMRSLIFSFVGAAAAFVSEGAAIAEPMTFRFARTGGNCNECVWTAAQGEITPETPAKFQEYISEKGHAGTVVLHSPGGNLLAGMELGQLIRKSGANTAIGETIQEEYGGVYLDSQEPGVCASACAFAFMGGAERYFEHPASPYGSGPRSRLGVHQFSGREREMGSEATQMMAGLSLLYALEMGIDPRVIVAASGTMPGDIYWFSEDEATTFNLDTTKARTEPWQLEPIAAGLSLFTTHHSSDNHSIRISLSCFEKDGFWRVMISEKTSGYEEQFRNKTVFDFSGTYPPSPKILIGDQEHKLTAEDFEHEAFRNGVFLVFFRIPFSLESSGGLQLEFKPGLARYLNDLTGVSVALPPSDWLAAARRNCVA